MIFDVWNLEVVDSVVTAKLVYKSDAQSVKHLFRPPETAYTLRFHLTVRTSRLGLDLECEAKAVIIGDSYIESMTISDVRRELSQTAYSGNTDHVLVAFEAYLNLALEGKLAQPVFSAEVTSPIAVVLPDTSEAATMANSLLYIRDLIIKGAIDVSQAREQLRKL